MDVSEDTFLVKSPGLMTAVQDQGRYGYQWMGMPVSGAMDSYALAVGNVLLGQGNRNAAALEITFLGPVLDALSDTEIAITGADVQPLLNNRSIPMWAAVEMKRGDRLAWRSPRSGCWSYLCVRGGVDVPKIMGSRSTNVRLSLGGMEGRPLRSGDHIRSFRVARLSKQVAMPERMIPHYGRKAVVRVISGPQDDHFEAEAGRKTFYSSSYAVSPDSNREGFRLDGAAVAIREGYPRSIPSEAFPPGGIQVRPDGRPLIVMNDLGGGGYVKIAHVITVDLPSLAQLVPGSSVCFQSVTLEEAHRILKEQIETIETVQRTVGLEPLGIWRCP